MSGNAHMQEAMQGAKQEAVREALGVPALDNYISMHANWTVKSS